MTGLGERLEDDWDAAVTKVREWTHRDPVPPIQAIPTSQENPMSVSARLADAEKAVEALAGHIKVLASNPLIDTLVEDGLGLLLTPGEVIAVKGFVAAIEAERAPAAGVVQAGEGVATAFQAAPPATVR